MTTSRRDFIKIAIFGAGGILLDPTSPLTQEGKSPHASVLSEINNLLKIKYYLSEALNEIADALLFAPLDDISFSRARDIIDSKMSPLLTDRVLYRYDTFCDEIQNVPETTDKGELHGMVLVKLHKSTSLHEFNWSINFQGLQVEN